MYLSAGFGKTLILISSFSIPRTVPSKDSNKIQFKLNGVFLKNSLIFLSPDSRLIFGKSLNVTQSCHPFVAGMKQYVTLY